MKDNLSVFEVKVWFDNYEPGDMQIRYVVAHDDDEVERKMNAYAKELKKRGYGDLLYVCGDYKVEVDYVIY